MLALLAWSPSFARLTASMLLRLQPTEAAATNTVAATRARDFSLMARGVYEKPARAVQVFTRVQTSIARHATIGPAPHHRAARSRLDAASAVFSTSGAA